MKKKIRRNSACPPVIFEECVSRPRGKQYTAFAKKKKERKEVISVFFFVQMVKLDKLLRARSSLS